MFLLFSTFFFKKKNKIRFFVSDREEFQTILTTENQNTLSVDSTTTIGNLNIDF